MLDFNSRPKFADLVNAEIDAGLEAGDRATAPRTYLGGSRLGVPCERALQFEYAHAPKDEGGGFGGRTLRIFAIGHALEDVAAAWLRSAGFDLYTRKGNRPDGGQFGFSVAGGRICGHVDGILADGPSLPGLGYPALWECKTMNARSWRETAQKGVVVSKPVYAAQLAVYQAYMEGSVAGISANPALFTAINKDTAELHHELVPFDGGLAQRMSDRAVRILRATEAGELLPRLAANPDHHECRMCAWSQRCWSLSA
ncbi:MAG: hypothetical protein IPK66_05785 [Rhodospirillales bacterium]|nr:hypothetical protein [Rhodospirillales bacterium]